MRIAANHSKTVVRRPLHRRLAGNHNETVLSRVSGA
jgi:hypothetical protein